MTKFVLDRIENIVGKEENADQHSNIFFFSPQFFQKLPFSESFKNRIVG